MDFSHIDTKYKLISPVIDSIMGNGCVDYISGLFEENKYNTYTGSSIILECGAKSYAWSLVRSFSSDDIRRSSCQETGMFVHNRKKHWRFPDGFNAWVVAGCPGISYQYLVEGLPLVVKMDLATRSPERRLTDGKVIVSDASTPGMLVADLFELNRANDLLDLMKDAKSKRWVNVTWPMSVYDHRLFHYAQLYLEEMIDSNAIQSIDFDYRYSDLFKAWTLCHFPGISSIKMMELDQILSEYLRVSSKNNSNRVEN